MEWRWSPGTQAICSSAKVLSKVVHPNVSAKPIGTEGIYRILVCRPNHRLGNAILLTPVIAELERLHKGAEIDIVAEGNAAAEIFSSFFSVNRIYCLPKRGFKHPIAFLSMLLQLYRTDYDLIVDPCVGSGFSRALTRILKGRRKIGYSDTSARSGLTHPVPFPRRPGTWPSAQSVSCAGMAQARMTQRRNSPCWIFA